jgi:hypothetical protein
MLPQVHQARCHSRCVYNLSAKLRLCSSMLHVEFELGLLRLGRNTDGGGQFGQLQSSVLLQKETVAEFRSQRRHGPATSQLGHCCLQAPFFGSANQHLNNPRCQLDLLPPKPKNQRCTTTTRGRPTCRSFVRILSTNKAGFSAAGSDPARREDAALVRHWRSASCRSPGRCCQVQKQATSRTHQYQDVVFTLGPGEFTMYNNPKAVRPVRYPVVPSPSEDDPNHRSTPWMTFRQPRIASCFRF